MFRFLVLLSLASLIQAACNNCSCTVEQITFVKASSSNFGSVDAAYRHDCPDPFTGCSRLVAYCLAQPNYRSLIELSSIIPFGPVNGPTVARLTCKNGVWFFAEQGMSIEVHSVSCLEVPASK